MQPKSIENGSPSYLPYKVQAVYDWADSKFASCQGEKRRISLCGSVPVGILDWQVLARCDMQWRDACKAQGRWSLSLLNCSFCLPVSVTFTYGRILASDWWVIKSQLWCLRNTRVCTSSICKNRVTDYVSSEAGLGKGMHPSFQASVAEFRSW